jgi:hypothetical protein
MMRMRYEYGGLPAMITHNAVRLKSKLPRIEVSLRVPSRANDMIGAHARPKRTDCLIDFDLSNNRSAVARDQCECGKAVNIQVPGRGHVGIPPC